jgi:hypothetical protein
MHSKITNNSSFDANTEGLVRHVPPRGIGDLNHYKGGFDKVTRCTGCSTIQLKIMAHPRAPCAFCGSVVEESGVARWKPEVTTRKWFKTVVVSPGQWIFSTGHCSDRVITHKD